MSHRISAKADGRSHSVGLQSLMMAGAIMVTSSAPTGPSGYLLAFWKSLAGLMDPGQNTEAISPGSHIILLGWLFFMIVITPAPRTEPTHTHIPTAPLLAHAHAHTHVRYTNPHTMCTVDGSHCAHYCMAGGSFMGILLVLQITLNTYTANLASVQSIISRPALAASLRCDPSVLQASVRRRCSQHLRQSTTVL